MTLPATASDGFTYTYDDAGRVVSVVRANGDLVRWERNHPNKWVTAVVTQTGSRTHRADYTYFADGKRQSFTSSVNGVVQQSVTYAYDVSGRLIRQVVNGFGTLTYQYDFLGRMTRQTVLTPTGSTLATQWEYGVSGLSGDLSTAPTYVRRITHTANGQVRAQDTLTHDYLGRLTGVQGTGYTYQYSYDARGRLTGEMRARQVGGTTYNGSSAYTYDASDNLNGGANGWQYDDKNLLTSAPAVGGMPGATGITYGSGGLLSGMNGRTFQYNGWGQLVQIGLPTPPPPPGGGPGTLGAVPPGGGGGGGGGTTTGASVTLTYDALGRVASVTDKNAVTRSYDYDGAALVGEQSASSGGTASYQSYAQGAQGYVGDFKTTGNPGPPKYYQYDPAGNLCGVYDKDMSPLWLAANNCDVQGNPQEGQSAPGNYFAAMPTAMVGNGSYRDPATGYRNDANDGLSGDSDDGSGIDLDALGESGSLGQMYGRAFHLGHKNLKRLPSWQAGSPERQFESQTLQMIPVVGQLFRAYRIATGWDPVSEMCVGTGERVLDGLLLGVEGGGKLAEGIGGIGKGGNRLRRLSDPLPHGLGANRLRPIRDAYEDIKLGRGTPRIDPDTGLQKVFRATELKRGGRGTNTWEGSLEWDVPGTNHRILEKPNGRLGFVVDHDYEHPRLFPSPWYPDGG